MTDDELRLALQRRKAVIVHFSHYADMRRGVVFPNDLQAAIANTQFWTLSCHVLWPRHHMTPVGSVGIILKPSSTMQIVSVSSNDAGSYQLPDGSDSSGGVPLSHDSFESTFVETSSYNEWRVRGAETVGVFVVDPRKVYVRKLLLVGHGDHQLETIAPTEITMREILDAFPNLNVYTMDSDGLTQLHAAATPAGT